MAINREKVRAAAQKYLQKNQLDKAIKEFERLVEDDPKDVRTLLKLGDLQTRAGDNASATQTYMRVAQFYGEQGFFLKAVAVYKQILKIDPAILEVNVKLAELYQQLGLLSDAGTQYRQLAQLFEQQERIEDCVGVLRKMIELDAENVASRVKLAEMYAKQNKIEEAKREFAEAASFLRKQGRVDDWAKVAERMVFFHPEDMTTSRELADIYIKKGDAKRALSKLQVCFKQNPRDVDTLELLASAFKDLGQTVKAVSVLKELAHVHKETHQLEYHAATMSRVLELAPDDAEARQALADARSAAARSGPGPTPPRPPPAAPPSLPQGRPAATPPPAKPPATASEPAAARARPPERPAQADDVDAEPAVVTAGTPPATAAPPAPGPAPEVVSRLLVEADIYLKYGLAPKALEHLRRIVGLAPENREARTKLKGLFVKLGDSAGATEQMLELGRRALEAGDRDAARDELEELLGLDPANAEARDLLAGLSPRRDEASRGSAAEVEVEVDHPALSGATDEVLPALAGAGSVGAMSIDYEPSPEAAGIDLDVDDETLASDLDPDADDEASAPAPTLATRRPATASAATAPQARAAAPVPASVITPAAAPEPPHAVEPRAPSAPARPAARHPPVGAAASTPERRKPEAPAAPTARPARAARPVMAAMDDLDALLASAVPDRGRTSAGRPAPVATRPTTPVEPAETAPAVAVEVDEPEAAAAAPAVAVEVDEPEAAATAPAVAVEVDESEAAATAPAVAVEVDEPEAAAAAPVVPVEVYEPEAAAAASTPVPAPVDLSAEIEEARFYLQTGLVDEARDLARTLAEAHPNHAGVRTLLAQLAEAAATPGDGAETGLAETADETPPAEATLEAVPPTVDVAEPAAAQPADAAPTTLDATPPVDATEPAAAPSFADEDTEDVRVEHIDLAEELADDFAMAVDDSQAAIADVFDQFKKGVAQQVDESDYETHYDLGIAYKEMGLLDDAIRELRIAQRAPSRAISALTMIGLCYVERGEAPEALRCFQEGLSAEGTSTQQAVALLYEIARAYESTGHNDEALRFYDRVQGHDANFRDVAERTRELRDQGGDAAAGGHELDELLASTEEPASRKISYL